MPSPWAKAFRRAPSSLYTFRPFSGRLGSALPWALRLLGFADFDAFSSEAFTSVLPFLQF